MKPLSFLIIEDKKADAHQLLHLLSELPLLHQTDWIQTTTDVFNRLSSGEYDLVFLDIRMPTLQGTDLLRLMPNRPPVIVVTAYIEYAVPSWDLDVTDFLIKPLDRFRLQRAINRALIGPAPVSLAPVSPPPPLKGSASPSIFLPVNRRMQQFYFKDILFIEAQGALAKIQESEGSTLVRTSLTRLETDLPVDQFMRVQKSFIVNIAHIKAIENRNVWVGQTKISVGEPYREQVRQFIAMGRRPDPGLNQDES